MEMTPLAPREPQMAVAAASFRTSMASMSEGLTESSEAYVSSLAFWKSKFSSGLSKILPSTTMSGSALPLILVTPRRRIDVPAPRLPELATMSRPAIWPCRASSAEVMARPSTSAMLNVCAATDTSRSGMASPPLLNFFLAVTVTSLICVASCSLTLKVVRVPMGSVTVL